MAATGLEKSREDDKIASNASSDDREHAAEDSPPKDTMEEPKKKQPSKFKQWWAKLGITPPLLILMVKGALPPTIGIAMYEAASVAEIYTTIGYLIAIISILSLAILPRAKFLQNVIIALIGTCIGAASALLGIYCSVKARENTTPANATMAQLTGYNSSQNTVAALWLTVNIWFANTLRASRPALQIPVIIYSIFITVGMTSSVRIPTMDKQEAFMRKLLITFCTGFALASGVGLFVVPISCRTILFKEMSGYMGLVQGSLKAQAAYMQSMTGEGLMGLNTHQNGAGPHKHGHKKKKATNGLNSSPEALQMKATVKAIVEMHGKVHGDLPFAKREIAYGKLNSDDLDDIFHHFRAIFIPILGMSTLADIFDRVHEARKSDATGGGEGSTGLRNEEGDSVPEEVKRSIERWDMVLLAMRTPFEHLNVTMVEAIEHCALTLELKKAPKNKKGVEDIEADAAQPKPGTKEYASHYENRTREVYQHMIKALKEWAEAEKEVVADVEKLVSDGHFGEDVDTKELKRKEQAQIFLVLYMAHLFYSTATAILDLVKYADGKVEDGSMKKKKLLHPNYAHLKKWLHSIFKVEDGTVDLNQPDSSEAGSHSVYEGRPMKKRDPEHLPPKNSWQTFGSSLRQISHFLGSPESGFGLRVTAATMTVGIVCFLHNSQNFFFEQRLVWSLVIIAIGMTPTSGSATFGFIGRVLGTTVAMIMSYINWYIVDGHRAGVIVFLFIFLWLEFYVVLKFPRFIQITVIAVVTQVLIVGYELQVERLGKKVATSNGQPYYPIYTLAPYRLACVAGGSLVSFIWTIFPHPITDRSQMRKDLGKSLYLLANFYSCVHTTVELWLNGKEGDVKDKNSPGRKLEKIRYKLFGKEVLLLASLRQHSDFTKFELTIGGDFPKNVYDDIIQETENVLKYMTLIAYATRNISTKSSAYTIAHHVDPSVPADPLNEENASPATQSQWLKDLSRLTAQTDVTSHSITTLLSLVSAAVANGSALPPYLEPPRPYNLLENLERQDKEILSVKHIEEPGYSAFAVMEVASGMISDDLTKLLKNVKKLVGEVDFAYHILSTSEGHDVTKSSATLLTKSSSEGDGKGKQD